MLRALPSLRIHVRYQQIKLPTLGLRQARAFVVFMRIVPSQSRRRIRTVRPPALGCIYRSFDPSVCCTRRDRSMIDEIRAGWGSVGAILVRGRQVEKRLHRQANGENLTNCVRYSPKWKLLRPSIHTVFTMASACVLPL